MRVLIVDDVPAARDRLRQLLITYDDLQVVGEAEDGEQAIVRIGELRPDLVLLDIQMPGCSGIEVAGSLPSPRPKIVFCTAFDQYAVDAFELCAVDYLLKPVSRARLAHAIERVRALSVAEVDGNVDRVVHRPRMAPARFLGKRGARVVVIPQKEVLFFGSASGLTSLHTADQRYVMEPTLNDFERRLDPAVFCRVSRTAIVNLDYVTEVEMSGGGYGEAVLTTG
ncbi:MAG TPA: LytTR family DNA-binding domain-containing protein, partial [Vicinamibacterales bacterium]|nr:LytTR family DNA-binding domain-containing protein [Vicinamibacterales bacterium]